MLPFAFLCSPLVSLETPTQSDVDRWMLWNFLINISALKLACVRFMQTLCGINSNSIGSLKKLVNLKGLAERSAEIYFLTLPQEILKHEINLTPEGSVMLMRLVLRESEKLNAEA